MLYYRNQWLTILSGDRMVPRNLLIVRQALILTAIRASRISRSVGGLVGY
jgi:hypothetical protein